jgi:Uma2 family endonuclease
VEKVLGLRESFFAINLAYWIKDFVRRHDLGLVASADGAMRLSKGRVRIPDIAFVSWDKLPDRKIPLEPIPDLVPDLAIELISANNTPAEMESERPDYFDSGLRLV